MLSLIDHAVTLLPALKECLDSANGALQVGAAVSLEDVRLQAPIQRPRKNIFGIGLNYRAHVAESAKSLDTDKDLPKQPVVFSKPPTAVIGPGAAIQHNASITRQLDWEVELAVIIGKTATRIPVEKAMDHVFGYSVMSDISARDNRRAGQWIFSKGMDTYAPFGPCIVTADEIPGRSAPYPGRGGRRREVGSAHACLQSISSGWMGSARVVSRSTESPRPSPTQDPFCPPVTDEIIS